MALAGAGVVEGAVVTAGASGAVMGVSNQLVLGRAIQDQAQFPALGLK
jgi:hypothetical protein